VVVRKQSSIALHTKLTKIEACKNLQSVYQITKIVMNFYVVNIIAGSARNALSAGIESNTSIGITNSIDSVHYFEYPIE